MALEKGTAFLILRRLAIIVLIGSAFTFGLAGTVYLSLRSPEVQVPEVVGQNYLSAESILEGVGLNIRKRASRYKGDAKPDTVLDQSPRSGEVVKKGQVVAVVVANEESGNQMPQEPRPAPETGNAPAASATPEKRGNDNADASRNDNQNKSRRNANRNTNANANRNANANNANANRNANANANTNRTQNRNTNTGSLFNRNDANRNANGNRANANRNSNTGRNTNTNRNTNRNSANRP